MEYDKIPPIDGKPEAQNYPHQTTSSPSGDDGKLRIQGPQVDTAILAEPITFPFSGRTAKNRFLKAPMTERLCHWPVVDPSASSPQDLSARGYPSEAYKHLYRRWGEGEIGIIVAGNVMLRYDAVEAFGNPILQDDHDGRVAAFAEGGAALNPRPVSASEVQLEIEWAGNKFNKPRALTIPEIEEMVKWWGETAYLCYRAGFDGVQVHCAHGYLLAQFLSNTTNKRTDAYGGSLENRSRIIFQILSEIRARVPDPSFILCVKLNSVEFQPGGQTTSDVLSLCQKLEEARVDFLDLSGGTFEGRAFEHKKESTRARESYFIEFAEMIRPLLKQTKVYVTGGLRTAAGMASAIASGACDGIGIGRPLGAEPYLCRDILAGKITGAIENRVPLPLNTQATGTQLQQVGRGDELVSDWSDEAEVARWVSANEAETRRKVDLLPKVDSSGYPVLRAEAGFAYLRA